MLLETVDVDVDTIEGRLNVPVFIGKFEYMYLSVQDGTV